jgi:hypothetical protein
MAARTPPREAALQLQGKIHALEQIITQKTPKVDLDSIEVEEVFIDGAFIYQKAQFNHTEPALRGYPYILKSMNTAYHDDSNPLNLLEQAHSLATETLVLVKLQSYANIRRVRAISSVPLTQSLSGQRNGNGKYFMVLDDMEETLQDRMQRWRKKRDLESSTTSHFHLSLFSSKHSRQSKKYPTIMDPLAARERCRTIGLVTARALAQLHQQDMAYGALSPQTIAFDAMGVLVLSDFSAASMVQDDKDSQDQKAQDVYLFGWLLWDLITLPTPNNKPRRASNSHLYEYTSALSLIPSLEPLERLIQTCWNATSARHQCPSLARIIKRLMEATMEPPAWIRSLSSSSLPVETCSSSTVDTTKGRSPLFRFKSSDKMSKTNKKNKDSNKRVERQSSGGTMCTHSSDTDTTTTTTLTSLSDIMDVRYGISTPS